VCPSRSSRNLDEMIDRHALTVPPPPTPIATPAMYSGDEGQPNPEDLEKRIRNYLVAIFRTLNNLNEDISLYLWYHLDLNIRRDPLGGNGLDGAYNMYEEKSNECRRLWMSIRATSEKRASSMEGTNNSSPSKSRAGLDASLSPLEYQSAHGEDELPEMKKEDQVTPMDVDPVEVKRESPQPPTPKIDPHPTKPKSKVRLCQ